MLAIASKFKIQNYHQLAFVIGVAMQSFPAWFVKNQCLKILICIILRLHYR